MSIPPPIARGYTLIELLVVMVVLGILASAALPLAEITVQRERERELKRALWEIRDAIDAYKRSVDSGAIALPAGSSGYPSKLEDLVADVPDTRFTGKSLHFLRRVPRDPFCEPGVPAEKSWALRSFQSSADRPVPGDDVYDVRSTSNKLGLNGVPLKDW